ncbi:hypothetical protein ES703_02413 [subsurface metagenome]
MSAHLADISSVSEYAVELEFSDIMNPSIISEKGLPLVPVKTEISANTLTLKAKEIHKKYGRIPYGSPIYIWEAHGEDGNNRIVYIGQTLRQSIQRRFEGHSALIRLLTRYVNEPSCRVYFKLCTRMDIIYDSARLERKSAIEHFPVEQAKKIIDDVEAFLIYEYKPKFNSIYVKHPKNYCKPFKITMHGSI